MNQYSNMEQKNSFYFIVSELKISYTWTYTGPVPICLLSEYYQDSVLESMNIVLTPLIIWIYSNRVMTPFSHICIAHLRQTSFVFHPNEYESTCKFNIVCVSIHFATGTLHKSIGEYLGCKQIRNMHFRSLVQIEICFATCYFTPQTSSNPIVTLIQHWYYLIVLDIKFTSSLECSLVVTNASNL